MALLAVTMVYLSAAPASALGRARLAQPQVGAPGAVTGLFTGVSCTSAVQCTAVGSDFHGEPFYANESGGIWGRGTEIGGGGGFGAVSCTASSVCTAIGKIGAAVFATEVDGVWTVGPATVQSVESSFGFSSVSCTSATDCTAAGGSSADIHSFPLLETEVGGVWTDDNFSWPTFGWLTGISCTTATDCTAVGNDGNGEGYAGEPTYVTEVNGVWGAAAEVPVPGGNGLFTGISCSSIGDCTAIANGGGGGTYYVVETGGVWGTATELGPPSSGTQYVLEGVSCADATDCTIVGTEFGSGGRSDPIAVTESGGVWGSVTKVTVADGQGRLTGVSCAAAATCTAVGDDGLGQPIYVNETDGVWGVATEVAVSRTVPVAPKVVDVVAGSGRATISWGPATPQYRNEGPSYTVEVSPGSKTCSTFATTCTISGLHNGTTYSATVSASNSVGTGPSAAFPFPFIPGAPVTTHLQLSRGTLTYANEATETASIVVAPSSGSATPTGKIMILAGTKQVCSATLHAGEGSCAFRRAPLTAGLYRVVAIYLGDSKYATTAATKVRLVLNISNVLVNNEKRVTFTVTVIPQFPGRPTGNVTINAVSRTLCSITLDNTSGSCALHPSELSPGTYEIRATYHGNANFMSSRSRAMILTVRS